MNIDFKGREITITNTELIELTTKLEEEERLKFEVYNGLRKAEGETPTEFKARRNERIREEYKLGGTSIRELSEKHNLTDRAVKGIVKGIKKPKRSNYIDRRNKHTEEYKEFLSEKIEREIELDVIERSEFKPLPLDEVDYYVVKGKYKHKESSLPYDCCTVDTETGELIEFDCKEFEFGKPKSEKVVKKAEKVLSSEPNAKLMAKLEKFCSKFRR